MRARLLLLLPLLAGCAGGGPVRQANETDVACIHRLYDYPNRSVPFQTAAFECAGNRPPDLTGDRTYQVQARSLNVPFTSRDPKGSDGIVLTGSRLAQPADQPLPPQLQIR